MSKKEKKGRKKERGKESWLIAFHDSEQFCDSHHVSLLPMRGILVLLILSTWIMRPVLISYVQKEKKGGREGEN
jgi:hypothetical protein